MTISRWILLRTRYVLDKCCRENRDTHFVFNSFSRKSCRLWDNVEKCGLKRGATNDVTWRIRVQCWISKVTCTHARACTHAPGHKHESACARAHTHTHTQIYNIYCFSTAAVIRERISILRYTDILCLVSLFLIWKESSFFLFSISVVWFHNTSHTGEFAIADCLIGWRI
jgi:hypothetical protein